MTIQACNIKKASSLINSAYIRMMFTLLTQGLPMQVSMAELNINANAMINRIHSSGESASILKQGKPIAKILPAVTRYGRHV